MFGGLEGRIKYCIITVKNNNYNETNFTYCPKHVYAFKETYSSMCIYSYKN
jgi:hypothetical protein